MSHINLFNNFYHLPNYILFCKRFYYTCEDKTISSFIFETHFNRWYVNVASNNSTDSILINNKINRRNQTSKLNLTEWKKRCNSLCYNYMIEVRIDFYLVNILIWRTFQRHFQKLFVSLELTKSLNTSTILPLPTKRCAVEEGSSGVLKWRPLILLIKSLISFDFSHGDLFSMVFANSVESRERNSHLHQIKTFYKKSFSENFEKNWISSEKLSSRKTIFL